MMFEFRRILLVVYHLFQNHDPLPAQTRAGGDDDNNAAAAAAAAQEDDDDAAAASMGRSHPFGASHGGICEFIIITFIIIGIEIAAAAAGVRNRQQSAEFPFR